VLNPRRTARLSDALRPGAASLLLAIGLGLTACDDSGPSIDGTLVVSTSTGGNEPDPDGYLLTIDGAESLPLDPTGTAEADLRPGRHTLRLLGLEQHCSVTSATSLEVDVSPGDTTSVAFEISCVATGARVTATSTGLDIDPNGFRVAVDGTDRGPVGSNGSVLSRIDPGSHTIALTGLAANCTISGPASRTVTIVDTEVASIEFEVVCTATTGVIGVVVEASGTDVEGDYRAVVDGGTQSPVGLGGPAYVTSVPAGDRVVSLLAPVNCEVENRDQSVTVTGGELIRDTVQVTFSVTCVPRLGALRITTHTTGPIPDDVYRVMLLVPDFYYGEYPVLLGAIDPNGGLISPAEPGTYRLQLEDIPASCIAEVPNPTATFTLAPGDTLDFEFPIACSP
jgi:hypothetical protein